MIQLADNNMGGASAVVEGRVSGFSWRVVLTRIQGTGSAFYSVEARTHNALGQEQWVSAPCTDVEEERQLLADALAHLIARQS